MWRVPVGTQIPVEVVEARTPSIDSKRRYFHAEVTADTTWNVNDLQAPHDKPIWIEYVMARIYTASDQDGDRHLALSYYYRPEGYVYAVYNYVRGTYAVKNTMGHIIINHVENSTSGNMIWVRMLDETLRRTDSADITIDGLKAGDFADLTVCYRWLD